MCSSDLHHFVGFHLEAITIQVHVAVKTGNIPDVVIVHAVGINRQIAKAWAEVRNGLGRCGRGWLVKGGTAGGKV